MRKFLFIIAFAVPLLAIEKEPLQEYRARRTRLAEAIKGNVLVLRAAPEQELIEYQQERNFYYLTGLAEPDGILLLNAATTPPDEILFLPDRMPAFEHNPQHHVPFTKDTDKATAINDKNTTYLCTCHSPDGFHNGRSSWNGHSGSAGDGHTLLPLSSRQIFRNVWIG